MMRPRRWQTWIVVCCSLAVVVPRSALAAALANQPGRTDASRTAGPPAVGDVALRAGGQFVGQLLGESGGPRAHTRVAIRWQGRELGQTVTDANGGFAIAGLRGGTYVVAAEGTAATFRLWAPGTAPPSAVDAAMLIAGEKIVRGQGQRPCYAGGRVGYSRLGALIRNPWVLAAVVGTAIAIPIATADSGNDSAS